MLVNVTLCWVLAWFYWVKLWKVGKYRKSSYSNLLSIKTFPLIKTGLALRKAFTSRPSNISLPGALCSNMSQHAPCQCEPLCTSFYSQNNARAAKWRLNSGESLTLSLQQVLKYAREHSGVKAATHYRLDPRRIRYWKKQKNELSAAEKGRAWVSGGGRKKVSEEFETELNRWIHEMRQKHNRVSRKMIQLKAKELYRHSRMEASL